MGLLNEYSAKVIAVIQKVPKGKVATYGQVAGLAGRPHAIRAVVWILHSCSKTYNLPWQRVINSKGRISFPPSTRNYKRQKQILHTEGIVFLESDRIDLTQFQWKKQPTKAKAQRKRPNLPQMFS